MQLQAKEPENIRLARIEQFKRDGYVVIENAIPLEIVEQMRREFMQAMTDKIERFKLKPVKVKDGRDKENKNVRLDFRPEGGNHDLNRWNMHLPTSPTFLNDYTIANEAVLEVIEPFVGKETIAFIIASDTPYPGSGFQNIHQDFPRFGLTVNIPLVDFTEENAPLEVWPGTHIYNSQDKNPPFRTSDVDLTKEQMEEIRETVPSKRLLLKAGAIAIRDQRLVHRGTANTGDQPRPCMSIWYKNIDKFSILDLTIPIPHRQVADPLAKLALWFRKKGRGDTGAVVNRKLLNFGNFFGRVVEEVSGSDRDYRRKIPYELWQSFSPKMKSVLRYASVETSDNQKVETGKRSWLGSLILAVAGIIFTLNGFYVMLFGKQGSKNS
jgi:ectoine hydroxylase-related dioxygenase (phytanoyl-CoA dioxygenase family)